MRRSDAGSPGNRRGFVRVVVTILVCLLLLGGAGAASYLIHATEPTATSEGATRRSAALVETVVAERGTHSPWLGVLGLVEPARDVQLAPRVDGQVVALEPEFVPGGIVRAGQELLRIDPADFELALEVEESLLAQVEAELAIEEGLQVAARQEFELLGEELEPANRSLVLREPQIASIRARLSSARSGVERARLELDRTTIRAPFDAQILSRSVNVGSQVAAGDALARLVGVDEYWIVASVPLRDLRRLDLPDEPGTGPPVRVWHTTAWAPGQSRAGRLARLIGTVDRETRLARVLVTVADPLGRENGEPPLLLGTIVQLEIEGRPLEDVVRLDRDWLRQSDTVWILEEGELRIRSASVVYRDAEHVYIVDGVEAGEHVVTTSLATVTEGLPLRRAEEPAEREVGGTAESSR